MAYNLFRTVVVLLCSGMCVQAGFFTEHAEGWHWYREMPIEEEEKEEEAIKPLSPAGAFAPPLKVKGPTEVVKAYREELERRLNLAWIEPTPPNLRSYQEMQNDMLNRSETFSSVWKQVVFDTPALDHSLVWPVNQKARHVYLDEQKLFTKETVKALSKQYGLFFFFSGDCPYCHEFAPIVKQFADDYGWEVIAISADGGKLPQFPNAQTDNGLHQRWNIEVLPSLFAVNPATGQVIKIAHGLTAIDEMETRIMALVEKDS